MSPKRDRRVDEHGNKLIYGPEYNRVSGMDCCICGSRGWWAHHVRSVSSGGVDKGNLAPLCFRHHTEGHNVGWQTMADRYDVDFERIAHDIGTR